MNEGREQTTGTSEGQATASPEQLQSRVNALERARAGLVKIFMIAGMLGLSLIWIGYFSANTGSPIAYGIAVTATVVLIIGLAVVWVVIIRPPQD